MGRCKEGHFPSSVTGFCTACPDQKFSAEALIRPIVIILTVIGVVAVIYFKFYRSLTKKSRKKIRSVARILFVFLQILTVLPCTCYLTHIFQHTAPHTRTHRAPTSSSSPSLN